MPSISHGWHNLVFPIQECEFFRKIKESKGVARRRTGRTPHKQTRSLTQRLRKKGVIAECAKNSGTLFSVCLACDYAIIPQAFGITGVPACIRPWKLFLDIHSVAP